MELQQSQLAAVAMLQAIQPEVQKYLEAVYAVAPVPEEYVKYRLHLATALPLALLDAWFELRRQTPPGFLESVLQPKVSGTTNEVAAPAEGPQVNGRPSVLFGPPQPSNGISKALPTPNNGMQDGAVRSALPQPSEPRLCSQEARSAGVPSRRPAVAEDSGGGYTSTAQATRFTEEDLGMISSLVGLETLTSTQEHCGSTSLFMFEQLTALDSLDSGGPGGAKRKRFRHQHFWRNTDKLDARERVYIPTSSIKPALRRNEPVVPKADISPEERTNAWTVCLTTRGVVSYLNKRISPLGVQLIRALQKGSGQRQVPQSGALASSRAANGTNGVIGSRGAEQPSTAAPSRDSAWTWVRDDPANQASKPGSSSIDATDSDSGSQGAGQKRKPDWQPSPASQALDLNGNRTSVEEEKPPELIPRIRRRKPA